MAESEHPAVELRGFRPVDLGDDQIQLRFDALAVPAGAVEVVPTLTLSREDLGDLGTKLKLLASDLPMVDGE
ncbi:hypothetical protein [Lichenibacterium dinghuense]|uniref:hypothetical protein n=1 Tax=Lichenibacterium dinghuense TaxID=2895977 RepID=UPI001F307170|nr:hypothetical protein [Lichenibacterium sp. 6Y81]